MLDFLLPPSIPSPRDVLRWGFRRRWLNLIRRIVAARLAQGSTDAPRDLLDLMASAKDPESGALFPPAKLADEVATMIVAGHETTAVSLFWSLFSAGRRARSPGTARRRGCRHRSRTRQRRQRTLGPRLYAALSCRRHCASIRRPLLWRGSRPSDDVAGDVPVKAKTVVLIAPWVLHRHRKLWAEPDLFDPGALSARRPAARPLCLSAVRHRPARLHRRAIRADRSDPGAGDPDPELSHRARRRQPGWRARGRHDPARSPAAIPAPPAIRPLTSGFEKRGFAEEREVAVDEPGCARMALRCAPPA